MRAVNHDVATSGKGKAFPIKTYIDPEGPRRLKLPRFSDSWHMKVVRLSTPTHRPSSPPGKISGTHSLRSWVDPRAAGRIKTMQNLSKDPIGNWTHDISACIAVLPRTRATSRQGIIWRTSGQNAQGNTNYRFTELSIRRITRNNNYSIFFLSFLHVYLSQSVNIQILIKPVCKSGTLITRNNPRRFRGRREWRSIVKVLSMNRYCLSLTIFNLCCRNLCCM